MQQEVNYARLQALIDAEDFKQAEEYCLDMLARGGDQRFWRTQLGYVCFLNERDIDAFYNRSTRAFETVIDQYHDDANAHFWLAYQTAILWNEPGDVRRELETVIQLVPNHPYARLVLAGMGTVQNEEVISLLKKTLEIQPANFRALQELSKALIASGQITEAINVLQTLIKESPYVETNYGIMNEYINGVLNGSYWKQEKRLEAMETIASLSK